MFKLKKEVKIDQNHFYLTKTKDQFTVIINLTSDRMFDLNGNEYDFNIDGESLNENGVVNIEIKNKYPFINIGTYHYENQKILTVGEDFNFKLNSFHIYLPVDDIYEIQFDKEILIVDKENSVILKIEFDDFIKFISDDKNIYMFTKDNFYINTIKELRYVDQYLSYKKLDYKTVTKKNSEINNSIVLELLGFEYVKWYLNYPKLEFNSNILKNNKNIIKINLNDEGFSSNPVMVLGSYGEIIIFHSNENEYLDQSLHYVTSNDQKYYYELNDNLLQIESLNKSYEIITVTCGDLVFLSDFKIVSKFLK